MFFERLKQIFIRYKFSKVLIGVLAAAALLFYIKTFYTIGTYFEETFLTKQVIALENHYTGKSKFGNINITVVEQANTKNSVDVIYMLPNNLHGKYTVNFKNISSWEAEIENIKDEDGKIIFQGGKIMRDVPYLFDQNSQLYMDDNNMISIRGKSPYSDHYKMTLYNAARFAISFEDTIRGNYKLLGIAILLLIFTLIDMKAPLFFFTLRHGFDVKDPLPSEDYINMQRISWYVSPIIMLILMIAAIS